MRRRKEGKKTRKQQHTRVVDTVLLANGLHQLLCRDESSPRNATPHSPHAPSKFIRAHEGEKKKTPSYLIPLLERDLRRRLVQSDSKALQLLLDDPLVRERLPYGSSSSNT